MVFSTGFHKKQVFLWPQWLAAFQVCLLSLMVGVTFGWVVPFVGRLSRSNAPFTATKEQISWIVSLISLCRPIGAVIGTLICSKLGSKLSVYICGYYFLVSWIFFIIANTIEMIFISLIFHGISLGSLFTTYSVYISEIAEPNIRGKLINLIVQAFPLGCLLGNITGAYLDPWIHGTIHLISTIIFLCTFIFIPHSPYYLLRNNRIQETIQSIKWYNRSENAQEELKKLEQFLKSSPRLSFIESIRQFNTPINRSNFIKINMLYSIFQLLGMYAILGYMEILIRLARVNVIDPSLFVILLTSLSIFGGWISTICISEMFGRITILFVTCIILCIVTITWGLSYHLLDLGYNSPHLQWITIVSVIIYRLCISMGYLPIVHTITSEYFAPNIKHVSICLTNILCAMCSFTISKNLQILFELLSHQYVFYIMGVLTLCIGIFARIFILETKGKTLQEIQLELNNIK